ncbi:hypothetical protein K439DRAFT_1196773 [Ramaria rubella]|nr:hypothetical protein K439DRAFT_1196773 [Ramaria rubella]
MPRNFLSLCWLLLCATSLGTMDGASHIPAKCLKDPWRKVMQQKVQEVESKEKTSYHSLLIVTCTYEGKQTHSAHRWYAGLLEQASCVDDETWQPRWHQHTAELLNEQMR